MTLAKIAMPSLPRSLPKAAVNKVHAAIEAHLDAAQALHEFLDAAEGDADEEDGDEDCCNAKEDWGSSARPLDSYQRTLPDPYEGDDCAYNETHGKGGHKINDSEDAEYSLGWPIGPNQEHALASCRDDAFFFGDGEGPDFDREPSLGSIGANSAAHSQVGWASGGSRDLEDERAGREPEDGL